MACRSCQHWDAPVFATGRKKGAGVVGYCQHDKAASHPTYHCKHYLGTEVSPSALGLTGKEIIWLRAHSQDPWARDLFRLYRAIAADPADPGPRAAFAATLELWREMLKLLDF
jgi:hypothetical protein